MGFTVGEAPDAKNEKLSQGLGNLEKHPGNHSPFK